ncbi:MAG TPA: thermonuclease family protein [Leptospiraceae bacterium]|nr:thermonuclease family protein [Leptospiraceae bacterium]HMW06730.1 thermonuclease family protein [Leptospiraceae bacterium]HMX33527.1 thermonuclease family protein [Leptospiraceae bacterium]HMY32036.1 thermonuclease family protein [Leptospiraceae bacterium]HMZ67300.1 thermonuclease family protein [Leptospiraceae bacterium]
MKHIVLFIFLLIPIFNLFANSNKKWEMLNDCKYLENKSNDGDSFHVECDKEYLFRLYFVDTPESDDSFPNRVEEQADYFGISSPESIELGKTAASFTKQALMDKKFTVWTRWKDAMGRSKLNRYYAIIIVDRKSLIELLVENGLARIHGANANLPDGKKSKHYIKKLKTLEAIAKKNGVGGWNQKE